MNIPGRFSFRLPALLAAALLSLGVAQARTEASVAPVAPAAPVLVAKYSPEAYLAQMSHRQVAVAAVGEGVERAYVFMPKNPPGRALPLIFFHHGWLGMSPKNFGGLIDLLVRRGAVLVYPVYQDGNRSSPQSVTGLAARADAAALAFLRQRHPGLADENRSFYAGYSMGAAISVNLALDPKRHGLPPPRALLLMAPGNAHHVARGEDGKDIYGPVEMLPADLPTLVVTGAADTSIGVPTAQALGARLCGLKHRGVLFLPSDSHGEASIKAGHGSPGAPDSRYDFPDSRAGVPGTLPPRGEFEASGSLNLLDFYGYWRLATALMDHVAGGDVPESLFADSPENRYLGAWPDGTPYKEARFEDVCPK